VGRFYWVVLNSYGFYQVLLGFIEFYQILLGFLDIAGSSWVLLSLIEFYWVLLGFNVFFLGFIGYYRVLSRFLQLVLFFFVAMTASEASRSSGRPRGKPAAATEKPIGQLKGKQ